MNRLQYYGLDIQDFPADTVVLERDAMRQAAALDQAEFTRRIVLFAPGELSLKQCLKEADAEFSVVCDLTGAKPIEHQWGLVPPTTPPPVPKTNSRIPNGYKLVARVATLKTEVMPPETYMATKNGLHQYRKPKPTAGGYILHDMVVGQFGFGSLVKEEEGASSLKLLDLDIFLAPRHLSYPQRLAQWLRGLAECG